MRRLVILMLRGRELGVETSMGWMVFGSSFFFGFLFLFWQALRVEALNRDQRPFFK